MAGFAAVSRICSNVAAAGICRGSGRGGGIHAGVICNGVGTFTATGSDQFGADHQRGLQFFVYRNRGRWYPVFRWKI